MGRVKFYVAESVLLVKSMNVCTTVTMATPTTCTPTHRKIKEAREATTTKNMSRRTSIRKRKKNEIDKQKAGHKTTY